MCAHGLENDLGLLPRLGAIRHTVRVLGSPRPRQFDAHPKAVCRAVVIAPWRAAGGNQAVLPWNGRAAPGISTYSPKERSSGRSEKVIPPTLCPVTVPNALGRPTSLERDRRCHPSPRRHSVPRHHNHHRGGKRHRPVDAGGAVRRPVAKKRGSPPGLTSPYMARSLTSPAGSPVSEHGVVSNRLAEPQPGILAAKRAASRADFVIT